MNLKDFLYYEEDLVKIYCGDCVEIMQLMENESADLVITSPPYSVEKEYETGIEFSKHLDLIEKTVLGISFKLKFGKILCWNIASNPKKNTLLYHGMILEKYLNFVDNIVWRKITGASPRFGNYVNNHNYYPNTVWEMIFVYSKSLPNVKGDMSIQEALKFRDDVWTFRSQTEFKDHPTPFPMELPNAAIQLYSLPDDTVLDPFLGSGTTCVSAKNLNRKSIGIDKDPNHCETAVYYVRNEMYKLKSKPRGLLG